MCPEAPIPIFEPSRTVTNDGMAGNVIRNLKALGVNDVDIITNKEQITKTRYVEEKSNQMLLRVDSNDRVSNSFDSSKIDYESYDAVIVADYDKGFLTENDIQMWLVNAKCPTFIDTKKKLTEFAYEADFIKINKQIYTIKIFESALDKSENFALIKGNLKKNKNPRVRVISSNIVKNYLMGEKLPNSFNKTISYFKKYKDCVLIFIRDTNLRSVSETLRAYKSKDYYKGSSNKLIKNYGIGAQIIKFLNIKKMILVTRSKKRVVGLDGYGIKISKQEIIK